MHESELSESVENYLEAIYKIYLQKKPIRVKTISALTNVSMPSVNAAVRNMAEKGLVTFERYGNIELTEEGIH